MALMLARGGRSAFCGDRREPNDVQLVSLSLTMFDFEEKSPSLQMARTSRSCVGWNRGFCGEVSVLTGRKPRRRLGVCSTRDAESMIAADYRVFALPSYVPRHIRDVGTCSRQRSLNPNSDVWVVVRVLTSANYIYRYTFLDRVAGKTKIRSGRSRIR